MSADFTKEEAIIYLGQFVRFKKDWKLPYDIALYSEVMEPEELERLKKFDADSVSEGAISRVDFIEFNDGTITF